MIRVEEDRTVAFVDRNWQPVAEADAEIVRVLYADGRSAIGFTKKFIEESTQKRAVVRLDFDPNQPRDESGKWTSGGGGGGGGDTPSATGTGAAGARDEQYLQSDGKYHVKGDVEAAARLIAQNKDVVLEQPHELSTLLDKLAGLGKEAAGGGEKKVYDLCRVSVEGTNLFCAESKGYPRVEMPQLAGFPLPGTIADKMPRDPMYGGVDATGPFIERLKSQGHAVTSTNEDAGYLRASQRELDGVKVAGIMRAIEDGKLDAHIPLVVSKDNYILDGHHRWAANVALSYAAQIKIEIPVERVDIGVVELINAARDFGNEIGLPQVAVGKALLLTDCACAKPVRLDAATLRAAQRRGVVYATKYSDEQPRDEHGRWTSGGGGGAAGEKPLVVHLPGGMEIPPSAFAKPPAPTPPSSSEHADPFIAMMRESDPDFAEDLDTLYQGMQQTTPGMVFAWDTTPEDAITHIVAANGKSYSAEGAKLVEGAPQDCHRNVAQLYVDGKVKDFATGYAFAHGVWVRHSWGLDEAGRIVETTIPRDAYYGTTLRPMVARIYAQKQLEGE